MAKHDILLNSMDRVAQDLEDQLRNKERVEKWHEICKNLFDPDSNAKLGFKRVGMHLVQNFIIRDIVVKNNSKR